MPKLREVERQRRGHIEETQDAGPVVSIKEATASYPEQWVLMRVTDFDAHKVPQRGQVVGHWSTYKEAYKELSRSLSQSEPSSVNYQVFSGDYYGCTGADFRTALEEAARKGGAGAWREW